MNGVLLGVCILLRNSRRKRSTENPGQAIPLSLPRKKLPPLLGKVKGNYDTALHFLLRPSSLTSTTFQAELLPVINNKNFN